MKRGVFINCKNLWKVVFFSHHLIFLLTLQTASAPAARSRRRPARRESFCVAGIFCKQYFLGIFLNSAIGRMSFPSNIAITSGKYLRTTTQKSSSATSSLHRPRRDSRTRSLRRRATTMRGRGLRMESVVTTDSPCWPRGIGHVFQVGHLVNLSLILTGTLRAKTGELVRFLHEFIFTNTRSFYLRRPP